MTRDMELVRKILLAMEMDKHGFAPMLNNLSGYTKEQIGYHSYLLHDAKLIEANIITSAADMSPQAKPVHLTWAGHEFIDNAKNEEVWGQAKQAVSKLGDVSFAVWTAVLTQVVSQNLGLQSF